MDISDDSISFIVGVDEVGRGPVAGPVTVGAVACHRSDLDRVMVRHQLVRDSKQLSKANRNKINQTLRSDSCLRQAVASVTAQTIDTIGITASLRRAVARVLADLDIEPEETLILLDGKLYAPRMYPHQKTIVRGDSSEWIIGAASIIAKVHRDTKMERLAKRAPQYGFEKHKGYGTSEHYQKIKEHGLSKYHRQSFLKKLR